jgi:CRISPR-associated protein Csm3
MSDLLLDAFHGRTRLEGTLTTRTSLHIGAGGSGDPLATDLPVVRDAEGRPYLPGASLKGLLRSSAEALYRGAGRPVCDVVAGAPCVPHPVLKAWREEPGATPRGVAERVWHASCPICRLFGSPALAGRARFPDLLLAGAAPVFELRNGVGIDRDRGIAADGILYDFEAVPPGTDFGLTVVIDNPTDADVGLLLYLFSGLDEGQLALGGKTSRGLGQVAIRWTAFHETTPAHGNPFRSFLLTRNLLAEEPPVAPEAGAEPLEETVAPEPPEEASLRLPETGDAEAWKLLIECLNGLSRLETGEVALRAKERGLSKDQLDARLGLGLGGKTRGAWEAVFQRLVAVGTLVEHGGGFWVAGTEPNAAPEPSVSAAPAPPAPPERTPLTDAYERFLGAMARRWEEEPCSIAS